MEHRLDQVPEHMKHLLESRVSSTDDTLTTSQHPVASFEAYCSSMKPIINEEEQARIRLEAEQRIANNLKRADELLQTDPDIIALVSKFQNYSYIRHMLGMYSNKFQREVWDAESLEWEYCKAKGLPLPDIMSPYQKQMLEWGHQRQLKEAQNLIRQQEQQARKQRKQEIQDQVDAARKAWKDAVYEEALRHAEAGRKIAELHEEYKRLNRLL